MSFVKKNINMNFKIHQTKAGNIAELLSEDVYATVDDFLDIIGNANYQGAEKIIIPKENIHPDFFDLKTRLAGEVLQKFSTYRQKLAIVGDFSDYKSKSLQDFIRESNRTGLVIFVGKTVEALKSFNT